MALRKKVWPSILQHIYMHMCNLYIGLMFCFVVSCRKFDSCRTLVFQSNGRLRVEQFCSFAFWDLTNIGQAAQLHMHPRDACVACLVGFCQP